MPQPKVVAKSPVQIDLEKGEHHWRACGESKAQPFCDGSHRGTPFTLLAFTVDEPQQAHLCKCKHSKNPPFCDGSHAQLGDVQVETAGSEDSDEMPVGIATQQEHLRAKLNIEKSSQQLARFLRASVTLMQVMARACGHNHLNQFNADDITTWKKEMADLTGIQFAGVGSE